MPSETVTPNGVLIVDSHTNMAHLVAAMLRTIGRRDLRQASDAAEALAELRRRPFGLVILDDAIAGNAVDLVRRLRADQCSQNHATPVILMSAAPEAGRVAAARDAGINEVLRKPFAANALRARIDAITARSQPLSEPPRRQPDMSPPGDASFFEL